ncbi:MAG: 16S rRNA (cytosine(967)-C(5))-methyltransferase RsmB [Acutalibacteraceae bacterium]|nr:16S rRNA (cytosine(967)-C(5))-methyltransferase RsmB [Acutalibacteraceae bacterium]
MSNQRKIAALALINVEKNAAYSNIALNETLKKYNLEKQESAFVSTLFYGVLERKITLDYYISKLSSQPLSKIPPLTLQALRLGVYQLVFMDKVPVSAAVNESVNIVKKSKESRLSGFVNAVLRNISRSLPALPTDNSKESISIRYSCSVSLAQRLIDDYGVTEVEKILSSALNSKTVTIRVNTLKTTVEELVSQFGEQGVKAEKTFLPNALSLLDTGSVENNTLYKKGYFHVQDLSSQICADLVGAKHGDCVLDVCAAPGGKTFTICENMQNKGTVIACDIHPHRVKLIEDGATRLGVDIIKTAVADATEYNPQFENSFDSVLCDVLCSGSGVIGRKPDIRYKDFSNDAEITALQLKILSNAFKYLKPGKQLVYSTCSIIKSENEDVVNAFLDSSDTAELLSMKTFLPHIDGTDGFFTAVIRKRGE